MGHPAKLLAGAVTAWATAVVVQRSLRRVAGRSMLPVLAPGDVIMTVPAWVRRPRPGDVVVVADPRRPDRLTVKRAVAWTVDGLVVHGDNPAASTDSRVFGAVPPELVRATVPVRLGLPPRRLASRSR